MLTAVNTRTKKVLHKISSNRIHHQSIWRTSSSSQLQATKINDYVIQNSIDKPSMPALGFGTWGVDNFSHEIMAKSVDIALKMGYKHLDCARVYGNEKEIGAVIADNLKNGIIKRKDLFITSKIFNHEWDNPSQALESSLKDLKLDYADAFLVHWPFQNHPKMTNYNERIPYTLEPLYKLHKQLFELEIAGLTRSIGACNLSIKKMNDINALCDRDKIGRPGIFKMRFIHIFNRIN